jgi:hypothetical protein
LLLGCFGFFVLGDAMILACMCKKISGALPTAPTTWRGQAGGASRAGADEQTSPWSTLAVFQSVIRLRGLRDCSSALATCRQHASPHPLSPCARSGRRKKSAWRLAKCADRSLRSLTRLIVSCMAIALRCLECADIRPDNKKGVPPECLSGGTAKRLGRTQAENTPNWRACDTVLP